jgi:hypothetical protein
MTDWQPIETAPRDGTSVLVYPPLWNGRSCSVAHYDNDEHAKPFWKRDDDMGRSTFSRAVPPTHWMPIPTPPNARNQACEPEG